MNIGLVVMLFSLSGQCPGTTSSAKKEIASILPAPRLDSWSPTTCKAGVDALEALICHEDKSPSSLIKRYEARIALVGRLAIHYPECRQGDLATQRWLETKALAADLPQAKRNKDLEIRIEKALVPPTVGPIAPPTEPDRGWSTRTWTLVGSGAATVALLIPTVIFAATRADYKEEAMATTDHHDNLAQANDRYERAHWTTVGFGTAAVLAGLTFATCAGRFLICTDDISIAPGPQGVVVQGTFWGP